MSEALLVYALAVVMVIILAIIWGVVMVCSPLVGWYVRKYGIKR